MAEPGRVVERIGYVVNQPNSKRNGEVRAVNVRRNRTSAETDAQFGRMYNQIASLPQRERARQFNRLSRAYTIVSGALAATGRDDEWAGAYQLTGRARVRRK